MRLSWVFLRAREGFAAVGVDHDRRHLALAKGWRTVVELVLEPPGVAPDPSK
jgi:hypothetical protein